MDRHALAIWLDSHRALLVDAARRIVGSHAEAEDIVQDVIVRACIGLDEAPRSAAAWSTTAIRNAAFDRLRHRDVTARFAQGGSVDIEPSTDDHVAERLRTAELVMQVVRKAGPSDAAELLLRIVFDAEHAALARRTGRSTAATRVAMHRALERVRAAARRVPPDDADERDRVERLFAICWQAVERHDPAMLRALLPDETTAFLARLVADVPPVRLAIGLVAGRHVWVLRQGATTLCRLPVGSPAVERALCESTHRSTRR